MSTMSVFKHWMRAATPEEQDILAKRAGTTRAYLYHISSEIRQASPELASAIERATAAMHTESKGRLPKIYRTDLSKACAACDFAQKCLGAAAVRAEFPIVSDDSEGGLTD
jgi:DNA-binding transcriptional regulator YdaS (Cro superfamily)